MPASRVKQGLQDFVAGSCEVGHRPGDKQLVFLVGLLSKGNCAADNQGFIAD